MASVSLSKISMSQIANIIRQLSQGSSAVLKLCSVTAVDRSARSVDCDPLDESAPILGVSLQGDQEGEDGFLLLPKVGSYVIVGLIDGQDTGAVLLTDELDALEVKIGDQSLEITSDGIILTGGALGGMVKVKELTDRLNNIERDVNSLKQILSSWSPMPNDGGAALKGVVSSWSSRRLQETKRSDYEDTKVKH